MAGDYGHYLVLPFGSNIMGDDYEIAALRSYYRVDFD